MDTGRVLGTGQEGHSSDEPEKSLHPLLKETLFDNLTRDPLQLAKQVAEIQAVVTDQTNGFESWRNRRTPLHRSSSS